MNTVNCSEYKVGDDVRLQLTDSDLKYLGSVVEAGSSSMKVEVPFYNHTVTYNLAEGQQVESLHKG